MRSEVSYGCGVAARWLPRSLGASILVAALFVAYGVQGAAGAAYMKQAVVMLGAVLAIGVVRGGVEVRRTIRIFGSGLRLEYRGTGLDLPFEEIERLGYAPMFTDLRRWIPAATVLDRHGREWRLPALVDDGDRMIREIVQRSGRHDLDAWDEALDLSRRMARGGRMVVVGFAVSAGILVAGMFALLA